MVVVAATPPKPIIHKIFRRRDPRFIKSKDDKKGAIRPLFTLLDLARYRVRCTFPLASICSPLRAISGLMSWWVIRRK